MIVRNICRHYTMVGHLCRNLQMPKSELPILYFSRSFMQSCVSIDNNTRHGVTAKHNTRRILQNNFVNIGMVVREGSKKSKGKGKKGGGATKLDLSLGQEIIDLHEVQQKMVNATTRLAGLYRDKFSSNLTANVLDKIGVDVDGSRWRVNEIAEVNSKGKEFLISCSDDASGKAIGKAIQKNLNIAVSFEGRLIRVPMQLSSEYRKDLVKPVKEAADKTLREIRDVQQTAAKKLKKDSSSTDTLEMIGKQVQLLFEMNNAQTKEILSKKLNELQS